MADLSPSDANTAINTLATVVGTIVTIAGIVTAVVFHYARPKIIGEIEAAYGRPKLNHAAETVDTAFDGDLLLVVSVEARHTATTIKTWELIVEHDGVRHRAKPIPVGDHFGGTYLHSDHRRLSEGAYLINVHERVRGFVRFEIPAAGRWLTDGRSFLYLKAIDSTKGRKHRLDAYWHRIQRSFLSGPNIRAAIAPSK